MFDTPFAVLGAILIVAAIADALWALLRQLGAYRSAPGLQLEDLTHLNLTPPPATAPVIASLAALGFQPVGVAGRRPPADPQIWYFADGDATTVAGVFTIGPTAFATIYSWFGEEAVMVVSYPKGDTPIRERDFRYQTVPTSVEEAYRVHCAQLDEFRMRYGSPARLDRMGTIIRLDAVFNQRFGRRRLRAPLIRSLARSAVFLLVGLTLLVILLTPR